MLMLLFPSAFLLPYSHRACFVGALLENTGIPVISMQCAWYTVRENPSN